MVSYPHHGSYVYRVLHNFDHIPFEVRLHNHRLCLPRSLFISTVGSKPTLVRERCSERHYLNILEKQTVKMISQIPIRAFLRLGYQFNLSPYPCNPCSLSRVSANTRGAYEYIFVLTTWFTSSAGSR